MKFLLLLGLVLAVSCGRETTGSSSDSSASSTFTASTSSTSSEAMSNLLAWYQSTTEASYYTGTTARTEYRVVNVYPSSSCTTQAISVAGLSLGSVYVCSSGSSVTSSSYSSRSVLPTQSGASKSTVTELANLFNGSIGTIVNVTTATSSLTGGTFFTVHIVKSSGYAAVYTIDSGMNSAFNPVYSFDSETRTESTLYQIY